MRGNIWNQLGWVFGLLLGASTAQAAMEPPLFYIEPYWHPAGANGREFALSWQYFLEDDDQAVKKRGLKVVLKQGSRTLRRIVPIADSDVMHANLGDLCTDIIAARARGGKLEIQIPFEERLREVPETLCPSRLGQSGAAPSKFVFLADTQEFPDRTENTLAQLARTDSRLVVNGGDLVQTGYEEFQWQAYFDSFREHLPDHVMLPVVGNHEYRYDSTVPLWKRYFGGEASDWFFDLQVGDAQVVIFNSSFEDDPGLIERQLEWMDRTLSKPSRYKIVTMHHAPFSQGIDHLPFFPRQEYKVLQEYFVPLFERHHVDLVLSGHEHLYERSFKSGIEYLVSGAAGGKMGIAGATNPFALFDARQVRTLTEVSIEASGIKSTTWNDAGFIEDEFLIPARR
jgi:hypothetical protein